MHTNTLTNQLRLLTIRPGSPFSPLDPASMENCVGGTSQLRNPSVAGGVTVMNEGLVGLGVTAVLIVLACFVGLVICLGVDFRVLTVVVL